MPESTSDPPRDDLPISRRLTRWLDDYYLDGILGLLLPGAGDALTGVASGALLITALRERVPTVILLRMLLNIGVDVVVGSVPFLGDAFDFVWRSNRRNLELIEKHRGGETPPGLADYAIVAVAMGLTLLALTLPVLWMVHGYRLLEGLLG